MRFAVIGIPASSTFIKRTAISQGYQQPTERLPSTNLVFSAAAGAIGQFPVHNYRLFALVDGTRIVKRTTGRKSYELNDHLGNVTVVVSDVKQANLAAGVLKTKAKVRSYTNYYAFGMAQKNRSFSAEDYRYGFNGQEKSDELEPNGYDFGARIYDSKIGRFLSVDPKFRTFPSESNYSFAGNSPIVMVDKVGEKKTWYLTIINEQGYATYLKIVDKDVVKTKTYINTITYTEQEGVGFQYSYKTPPWSVFPRRSMVKLE